MYASLAWCSAADSEHFVGELMKGFMKSRTIGPPEAQAVLSKSCPNEAEYIGARPQGALPTISLTGSPALTTVLGRSGDTLLATRVPERDT
jgi:D-sedoheptulose 7-phosphate isomerase